MQCFMICVSRERQGLLKQQKAPHAGIRWQSYSDKADLDLQSCGQFMATPSLPHTSFVRNAIIIAPLSMSPMWHPYLKSIFSCSKQCPFPLQPTSPLTQAEKLTQVVTRIINLSNFNKCTCSALYFHISCFIKHFPLFDGNKGVTTNLLFAHKGKNYMETARCVCAHAYFKIHEILLHATVIRFQESKTIADIISRDLIPEKRENTSGPGVYLRIPYI